MNSSATAAYFERIGYKSKARADLDTLQQLHALHPLSIPFENLDSWLGLPVRLEEEHVFDKLVTQGRGGYCFEHNLLLMRMLRQLGFEVRGLAARVLWETPEHIARPRTHMLLLVTLNGLQYIADVGFGGLTLTAALELNSDAPQLTPHENFRIVYESGQYVMSALLGGNWRPLYRFNLETQAQADYAMANWYVSTHPQSRFISDLIAGRADTEGRHALLNARYTRYFNSGEAEQTVLNSPAAVLTKLEEVFLVNPANLPDLEKRIETLFLRA